ncbi:putative secondary metabolism biosynthetic enzyme [Paecilomyces lecythidis]|uniref:Secondary metabolism biosynthetic enzyme n=1 Tax=Paecilomyces lecythidis TaxID=3004212 RepID=A0ABR3Y5A7_9EURO
MRPKDTTIIISGGASGLGLDTAQRLHREGAYVLLLDLNTEAGEAVVKELGDERAKFVKTDITDSSSIKAALEVGAEWIQKTGKPFSAIVAAAGVSSAAKIYDARSQSPLPISNIDFVMNVNVRGTLDLVRQGVPHLIKNEPFTEEGERGVIILVSSSAAFDGQPGQVTYAASKGAIASVTLPLARDLSRYGIRVVAIAPSLFDSNMTKGLPAKARASLERVMEFPRRPGKPEEFSHLVQSSIENTMLNGTVIRLDGAMRMPSKM